MSAVRFKIGFTFHVNPDRSAPEVEPGRPSVGWEDLAGTGTLVRGVPTALRDLLNVKTQAIVRQADARR